MRAVGEKKVELSKLSKEQLPSEMQSMTPEQRTAYLEKKRKERAGLQARIRALVKARKAYVAAKRKLHASSAKDSFDEVVLAAMREQLSKKGFAPGK